MSSSFRQRISYAQNFLKDPLPSSLTFEQWLNLFEYFKNVGNEQARYTIAGSEMRLIEQQKRLRKVHRTRIDWQKME